MADPISIATGALALAGTGISIAKSLKAYVDSVRKAEEKLKPVIRDVEVMSGVLTQIGTALENGEIRKLCKPHFFGGAKRALESCTENFQTLITFFTGLTCIEGDEVKMTISARLSLYFKQQQLDTLRGNMGESKASLNLVIGTLQIVITMRTAPKDSAAVEELKKDMQYRLEELENEKRRAIQLKPEDSEFLKPTKVTERVDPEPSQSIPREVTKPAPGGQPGTGTTSSAAHERPGGKPEGLINSDENKRSRSPIKRSTEPDRLITCLEDATRVSSALRVEIFELIDRRKAGREYNSTDLHTKYGETQAVFSALWRQEQAIPAMQRPLTSSKPAEIDFNDTSSFSHPSSVPVSDMRKKISYTKIMALPSNVPRKLALQLLHSHEEIIRMNPHVSEVRPIDPPGRVASEDYFSNWYAITKTVTWRLRKNISYNACFRDQVWGMQSHIFASSNAEIRQSYRIGGNQPGEPKETRQPGMEPPDGLYLREDVNITCQVPLTARSIKKEIEDASVAIIKRLQQRVELLDEGKLHAMFVDGKLKPTHHSYATAYDPEPKRVDMWSNSYSYAPSVPPARTLPEAGFWQSGTLASKVAEGANQYVTMEAVELPGNFTFDHDRGSEMRKQKEHRAEEQRRVAEERKSARCKAAAATGGWSCFCRATSTYMPEPPPQYMPGSSRYSPVPPASSQDQYQAYCRPAPLGPSRDYSAVILDVSGRPLSRCYADKQERGPSIVMGAQPVPANASASPQTRSSAPSPSQLGYESLDEELEELSSASQDEAHGGAPVSPPARVKLADRAKYEFPADSEDEEMENEIEDNLDAIYRGARTLNQLGMAMRPEIESRNTHIDGVIMKTDKVDDPIAVNRPRLDRLGRSDQPTTQSVNAVDELLRNWTTLDI